MDELIAYFNGEFVPDSQCVIHATDRGFRTGDVVYDLQRTFDGKIFRLREHLERYDSLHRIEGAVEAAEGRLALWGITGVSCR